MTLEQLRIFLEVATRGHLTHAAADLHLTPSAVSSAIQVLERRYDVRLFHRVGRGIELSAEGRAFLDEARRVLDAAASAERTLREIGTGGRGTLAIAASQTSASHWLPPMLMLFRDAHPRVDLSVNEGNTQEVAEAVAAGRADLGIIEGEVERDDLSATIMDEDRIVLVCAPAHPLGAAQQVTPHDLATARWILRERGSGTRSVFEAALRRMGIDPEALDIALELPTPEAMCAATRAGTCLTAVSDLVARPHIEAGRLTALRLALPVRHFAFLRHRERRLSKAALAFEQLVTKAVRAKRERRDPPSFDI